MNKVASFGFGKRSGSMANLRQKNRLGFQNLRNRSSQKSRKFGENRKNGEISESMKIRDLLDQKLSKLNSEISQRKFEKSQSKPKRNLNLAPDFKKIYSQVQRSFSITKNLNLNLDKMVETCSQQKEILSKNLRIEKTRISNIFETLKTHLNQVLEAKKSDIFCIFDNFEAQVMDQEHELHSQANKLERLLSELPNMTKRSSNLADQYIEVTKVKILDSQFRSIDTYDERWACGEDQLDLELQKLVVNSSYKQLLNKLTDYPTLQMDSDSDQNLQDYLSDFTSLVDKMAERVTEFVTVGCDGDANVGCSGVYAHGSFSRRGYGDEDSGQIFEEEAGQQPIGCGFGLGLRAEPTCRIVTSEE